MLSISSCNLCPRDCGVNRLEKIGFCQAPAGIKIARAALHFWEEPCLSGTRGSGTVFFSGCTLRCCFCQNFRISSEGFGQEINIARLAEIFLDLQNQGAHNINLVTATQYLPWVVQALDLAKPHLQIPVVFNSGGYEKTDTIKALKGYVNIFLPDLKYFSSELAREYSGAKDYFPVASAAVGEMLAQTGGLKFDEYGILQEGVIIRHLVLPGARADSFAILKWISKNLPGDKFLLSLMSQYTPAYRSAEHKVINRRITTLEYQAVVREAVRLGLKGFMQERSSAGEEYTPPFDLQGVL